MMNAFHMVGCVGKVAALPGRGEYSPRLDLDAPGLADIYVAFSTRLVHPAAVVERGKRSFGL
jgi:hypothetical protein